MMAAAFLIVANMGILSQAFGYCAS